MEIYLQQDGARSGPYSLEQVRIWYRDGLLPADSKAWFDGCADWIPVEEIPGIAEGSSVHMVDISTVPPFEAYQGEEPYVFASYAHKDAALIYPELTQLNDAGFNIWYDEGVDASSEWPEEIAKAVIGCAVFIVFVSPRATQSVNCRNEINLALNKSKPFLAIYLEETELPPGLELRMGDLQAILRYKLPVDRYQKKTHDSLNLLLGKKPARSRTRPPVAQKSEATHEPEAVSAPVVKPSPAVQVDVGKASPKPRRKSLIVVLASVFLMACGTLGFVFLGDDGKGEQETPTPDSISVRIFTPGESWTVPTGSIEMLWCEPGTFAMGSPKSEVGRMSDETEHNVTLTKGFYLGKYEVTQAQYEAVMVGNTNGLNAKPSEWPNNPNRPVEKVSWNDAQVFLTRLNAQQAANLPAGWSYVLPTESQWEYACRAGTTTAYPWGATIVSSNANYNWDGAYNTGSDFKQTRDVGQYAPNPWGFFDMHGNVWEWTADRYQSAYPTGNPVTDPTGPASGSPRVGRGGSWYADERHLHSAARSSTDPGLRHYSLGFRLSLRQTPVEQPTPGESWTVPTGSIEMLWCEPGVFEMGSPLGEKDRDDDDDETRHTVTLTEGYWLGKHEVTQSQWELVTGSNPSRFKEGNRPVEKVSWPDTIAFCKKLTELEHSAGRLPSSMSYQLPTEAQWEYACRAGTRTAYSFGDSLTSQQANISGGAGYLKETTAVGKYPANAWGFYDMHGNVWEWCTDWHGVYPPGADRDPVGPAGGLWRVKRGGSFYYPAKYARSADRSGHEPRYSNYFLGFRLSLRKNGFAENSDSNVVVIKDANLKAEILKTLGKTDGELTADDLLSLKSLQIYPQVVHDLAGLEEARNLEVLKFGCQAKELSPLANLTNLRDLHLDGTEISSLEVFSGLKNLEALSFRSCVIKDRSPLEGLPNLKVLSFEYVEILNFAPFSKLHSLEELRHNNSNVSNISDVRNLTNLKFLGVQTDATCDLSPVGFLKNLEVLHVKGARKNLGVLSKLPKIQRLVFSTTDFTDSSPLRELAGIDLQHMALLLDNCGISDFSPLHELKIGSLQISHNPISKEQESMLRKALPDCRIVIARSSVSSPEEVHFKDANLIAAIRKALNKPEGEILEGDLLALNKLSIWEAPVSDISGLEKALNLEQLGFSHGSARGIKDFSPLAQLPEFRELYFDGASVSDLKAFSELKNLEVLSVQNTEVSDISSVRGLANLKRLDIVPTAVCDLSPLQSLQNLESLVLTGSPNELEVFTELSKLSRLYLSKCGLVDIGPLAKLDQSLVRSLSLTNNQITDFRPLHKLKLKELFIDENPISEEQKTMLRKALPDTAIRHGGVYWKTN